MRKKPELLTSTSSKRCIIAGTYGTPFIKKLMSAGKIDKKELDGKMKIHPASHRQSLRGNR